MNKLLSKLLMRIIIHAFRKGWGDRVYIAETIAKMYGIPYFEAYRILSGRR